MSARPPCLLTMPGYGGTLAAVRSLGVRDVRVTVAGEQFLAPARWSRHAARWVRTPPASDSARYIAWLLEFGRAEPGHVLYPTSDDLAFLFAANAEELGKYFLMYQPTVATCVRLLDKVALSEACRSVGLDTVPTWVADGEESLERIAREAPFPVLIKARTQVMRTRQTKGIVVARPEELLAGYRAFLAEHSYLEGMGQHFGNMLAPMVQQYFPGGAEAVYSITGFIDRTFAHFDARAAVKVFQRTRPVGLGVCFEAAPLEEALAERVRRLCVEVGHFGVFEVEIVRDGARRMVIDFNPRYFGQMGFDEARGLPLAYLAYLGAAGDTAALRDAIEASRAQRGDGSRIFAHRFIFHLLLLAQRFGGSVTGEERQRWMRWYADNAEHAVDASLDPDDWLPGVVHAAAEVWPGARALRNVLAKREVSRERPASGRRSAEHLEGRTHS